MTGLSIGLLARALAMADERLRLCNYSASSEYAQRRIRQRRRFLAALCDKDARVRELEAQAARDAEVRDAASEYVCAHTHYMCANEKMKRIAYMAQCDALAALRTAIAERAALAARKEE